MANNATILLFHIDAGKEKQIRKLCQSMHISVTKVNTASYNQSLGYLAGIQGFSRNAGTYKGAEFPLEMLVFSGMDSHAVDSFLAAYKKASIPPIGLKAILTQHNIFWTAEELFKELFKEHMQFSGLSR